MKTLHLMRHAKSSWSPPPRDDHQRDLNVRGRRDAPRMGRALAARMCAWISTSITGATALKVWPRCEAGSSRVTCRKGRVGAAGIERRTAPADGEVEKIFLTHGHMDHCAAADVLRQQLRIPIEGPHEADRF